jgi:hypothetical protein
MAAKHVVTMGFGNGTFTGSAALIVTIGYLPVSVAEVATWLTQIIVINEAPAQKILISGAPIQVSLVNPSPAQIAIANGEPSQVVLVNEAPAQRILNAEGDV